MSALSGLGVEGVARLLGKGHSSVVLEVALVDGSRAALKVLRTDSKRTELLKECDLMKRAYPLSPRVMGCGRDYILMEVIEGTPAAEAISKTGRAAPLVFKVISAGRGLDILGVDHAELSRAHRHVVVTPDGRVKILDYESATASERPRNVCRLASWLLYRVVRVKPETDEILELLREYKRAGEEERRRVFPKLLKQLALALECAPQGVAPRGPCDHY